MIRMKDIPDPGRYKLPVLRNIVIERLYDVDVVYGITLHPLHWRLRPETFDQEAGPVIREVLFTLGRRGGRPPEGAFRLHLLDAMHAADEDQLSNLARGYSLEAGLMRMARLPQGIAVLQTCLGIATGTEEVTAG